MKVNYYNNFGLGVVSIGSTLAHIESISISKLCLIFPLLSHQELLNYLSRKTTEVQSIEKLIIDKTSCFSNYNKRYYDSLCLTLNAVQYLNDLGYIKFTNNHVILLKPLQYDEGMGKRAGKIFRASKNIAILLQEKSEKLYLNLRVEL